MKTVIIGATPNSDRYAYKATELLKKHHHEVFPIGIKAGQIGDSEIITSKPILEDIHTVTLYIAAERQPEYEEYIYSLNPKRIIFNPGTENDDFCKRAETKGITCEYACTLVLLNTGNF
jgi:predicted CoA-binding protein